MKRFHFRLERVVRVREIERDRARGDWAAAQAQQTAIQTRVEQVREAASAESAGMLLGGGGDATSLRAAAFRSGLRAQALVQARAELVDAQQVTEQTAVVLRDAAQRVDALGRLERRQREEWQLDVRRDEAKEMDDIATTRAGVR